MNKGIQLELTDELREFVDSKIGNGSLFTSADEYIRDMLRQRKIDDDAKKVRESVLEGYEDILAGRTYEFDGDLRGLMDQVKSEREKSH